MKKRMTGGGKLSRKILTVMLLGISATSWAVDNSIYIDQAGDYSTITMTQDGAGNKVRGILTNGTAGGNTDPAKLVGNSQTVIIDQAGPNNILSLGLNTIIGTNGKGIDVNYKVDVGGNTAYINSNNNGLGQSSGNVIDVIQLGGNAVLNVDMLGNSNNLNVRSSGGGGNELYATINANNVNATVSQTLGGGNITTLNLTGNDGTVDIVTKGTTNITTITQSGGGVNGQYAKLDIDGNGNTTTVTQSGVNDNIADIKIIGNANTNTITQSGGATIGQYTKVDIAGSSNQLAITQQGSVDNLTNIKLQGSYNHYTILQKN
jgi:hypothetical protein